MEAPIATSRPQNLEPSHAIKIVRLPLTLCQRNQTRACEVVEVRNLQDADGYPCPRTASKECSDCAIEICDSHTETCGICRALFCPSCLSFHQAEHPKPASAGPRAKPGTKKRLTPVSTMRHRGTVQEKQRLYSNSWAPLRLNHSADIAKWFVDLMAARKIQ